MTIQEATIEQLKALAYDTLVLIEQNQQNLKVINAEISTRNKNMNEEEIKVEEVVTEVTEEVTPVEVSAE